MTETKGLRAEAGDAGGTGRVCVVLLPGLDGTGVLFRPFLQACPEHVTPVVIDFPRDERLDYAELEQHVVDRLPTADRTVIVGESFSGPLALRVAARRPAGLIGVVLCASFVRPPGACWLACLPWRLLLRLRAPDVLLRRLLTGREKAAELVPLVREALGRACNSDITLTVFPGADHGLFPTKTGGMREMIQSWEELKGFVPNYLETISEWLRARFIVQ